MDNNSMVRRSLTRQEFCFKKHISPLLARADEVIE